MKSQIFYFFYALKLQYYKSVYFNVSAFSTDFFPSHFVSNLMLPAYLLGMILVVNIVCIKKKMAQN